MLVRSGVNHTIKSINIQIMNGYEFNGANIFMS